MLTPADLSIVVVIAGPTASGKSALAIDVAERVDGGGEIVCADSRQVYAGMPIATAAPSIDDKKRVRHHLYGVVDPAGDPMTAAAWCARCDAAVADVCARGKVPIIVGGTGLYLRAWRLGLDDPHENPRDMAAMLAKPPRPIASDERTAWIYVDADLAYVEPRIRARAAHMFEAGVVDEATALRSWLGPAHPLLGTLGVAEALGVVDGTLTRAEALAQTTRRTRQYARRQRTWFKKEAWWQRIPLVGGALGGVGGPLEAALHVVREFR